MITGSTYYPMLFASEIRRRFKVPVVLDFQDPWVSAWGAAQKPLSKAGLSHRLATLLEPHALRAADFVTSVSDIQNAEMAARYAWLDGKRMAGLIHEIPRRLPFLEALSWLARSQGVLLIGSDEPHYTASKIYPGLMSGRPFLSLFHRESSAHAILTATGGGSAFSFATRQELEALELPLMEALRTLVLKPETLGTVDPAAYAPYEASNVARRFAAIFDRL